MNTREYSTLHLDISIKGTALLLLFCCSAFQSQQGLQQLAKCIP